MRPEPSLRMSSAFWAKLTDELHRRTEGCHESGVFLLGHKETDGRRATRLIFYDDLDPDAYANGVCVLHAEAFGQLWSCCANLGVSVVADAHVHPGSAVQSRSDRNNPMVAQPGHLALILPLMARLPVRRWAVGVYEYLGDHQWRAHGGRYVSRVLKIEGDQ